MLKPLSLLIMRVGTGMLLVLWGGLRLAEPGMGTNLAEKYYGGVASASMLQTGFAVFEAILGALVVLGLLRKYTLPLQALVLVGGALAIWKHFLDPFGMYLHEDANLLFFPSLTVAGATLALIAFRKEDTLSLDRIVKRFAD